MTRPRAPDVDALRAQADALLESDRVTAPTRAALAARLAWRGAAPRALTAEQVAALDAVARRLVPLGALDEVVDLAGRFDADLADGPGDGWRYAAMPHDREAVATGLDRLAADGLLDGDDAARDRLLARARAGIAGWPVSSVLWFEEVLARLVQLAYAHPLVQLSIGYDGMADADGFPAHG